jgi:pSer/pThr/pTyr-binding forkhead associated (FHA) protein
MLSGPDGKQTSVGLSMRIGSDDTCDIVVIDPSVSGCHAIIGAFPDGLLIRDEDSATGTFINNEKIEHVTALMSGDRIRVGKTEFLVEIEVDHSPAKRTSDRL